MFMKDGQRIQITNGMVIDDVQIVLPLSVERLAELGITEVPDPARPDDRFYYVGELQEDGAYPVTPKPRTLTNELVWEGIKAKRDTLKVSGVKVGAKWFHSDDSSRIQQIGLVMMGASLPAGLQWKTLDGSFVTMTQALAGQIFAAQAANDQALFGVAETHRAALIACADPAVYDYSTGWPETFVPVEGE